MHLVIFLAMGRFVAANVTCDSSLIADESLGSMEASPMFLRSWDARQFS